MIAHWQSSMCYIDSVCTSYSLSNVFVCCSFDQ